MSHLKVVQSQSQLLFLFLYLIMGQVVETELYLCKMGNGHLLLVNVVQMQADLVFLLEEK